MKKVSGNERELVKKVVKSLNSLTAENRNYALNVLEGMSMLQQYQNAQKPTEKGGK